MWVWIIMGIPRCLELLVKPGDQLVCMCDVFMFIFIHSVVELVDDYMYRLMVSLFVYADVGPRPSPGYQRRVVAIAPTAVPARNPRRRRQEVDDFMPYLEWLAYGIFDDSWQHLNNDLIATIHIFPPEWTSMMRRVAMACDYLHRAMRGDLPAEDESFEEDDDTEPADESESD